MSQKQTTILQFGLGKFIRSFADLFITESEHAGQEIGAVTAVQSTAGTRAEQLRHQNYGYHVLVRGVLDGGAVDEVREVHSIHRAIVAHDSWQEVLEIGISPDLRVILSNTTEVGYRLNPADNPGTRAPVSFPARLLTILKARYDAHGQSVTIIPCELIENNATRLQTIVVDVAQSWGMSSDFIDWLRDDIIWLNNLVDRITSDPPDDHPLIAEDRLLTVTEPFAFWAIESSDKADGIFEHPAIVRAPDIGPYGLRKVRILNGAHTALVLKAMPLGFTTVREAVEDPEILNWLKDLLHNEIIPTIVDRVADAELFAAECLDRFRNPYLVHMLSSIAWEQDTKIMLRLVPTYKEYVFKLGKNPRMLRGLLKDYV